MTLLRRPAPRFFLWAALLVGVAAAAGAAGFSPWLIAGIEFVAWVLVAISERRLSGPWTIPAERVYLEPLAQSERVVVRPRPDEAVVPAAVIDESPAAEWPPEPMRQTQAEPEQPPAFIAVAVPAPPPVPVAQPRPAAPVTSAAGTPWNIWTLERIAQEKAPDNAELAFLVVHLRDFAGADGILPAGFDSLVRESFGDLLPRAG